MCECSPASSMLKDNMAGRLKQISWLRRPSMTFDVKDFCGVAYPWVIAKGASALFCQR